MAKVAREFDYYPAPQRISDKEMARRWAKAFGSAGGSMGKDDNKDKGEQKK